MEETARKQQHHQQQLAVLVALRKVNTQAWSETESAAGTGAHTSLDSSLKKNTAFVKKVRLSLNAENLESLKKDLQAVSLEKYLSELVSAVAEGLTKVKLAADIRAAVELVSLLHQRFGSKFTFPLAFQVLRGLAVPPQAYLQTLPQEQRERDEQARVVRQRPLLRLVTELWLVNVIRTVQDAVEGSGGEVKKRKLDESVPLFVIRELTVSDAKTFTNVSIIAAFLKNYGYLLPESDEAAASDLASLDDRRLLLTLVRTYFDELKRHLERSFSALARETARFEESTIAHGSVSATREAALQDMRKTFDKQLGYAQTLAEALGHEQLTFEDKAQPGSSDEAMIRGVGTGQRPREELDEDGIWEDEDERRFYTHLVSLKDLVPSDLLNDGKPPVIEEEPISDTTVTEAEPLFNDDVDDDEQIAIPIAVEEIDTSSSNGARLTALLIRLPDLSNKDLIDSAAVEFAFVNSKASRNRLQRTLLELSPTHAYSLPFYGRFLATLAPHMPTLVTNVVEQLHKDFRRFAKHKNLSKDLPLRNFNARYLSELVKFKLVPPLITFHVLKTLSDVLDQNNAEVLAGMLESCGRALTRDEATSTRMQSQLELIMRKARASAGGGGPQKALLENAYLHIFPPQQQEIQQKQHSPEDLYARRLVRDMTGRTVDKVSVKLRKFAWKEPGTERCMFKIFSKPWKVDYGVVPELAKLLASLARHHSAFVVRVIDAVCEHVHFGLEANAFSDNQRRIATCRYVAELYNAGLIDATLVLRLMELVLTHGHPNGRPTIEGNINDAPEDLFRLRLAITLLQNCSFALAKVRKEQFDVVVGRLQLYIQMKRQLPRDVEYAIVSALRRFKPDVSLEESAESATRSLEEALKAMPAHNEVESAEVAQEVTDDEDSSSQGGTDDESESESASESSSEDDDNESRADDGEDEGFILLEKKKAQDDLDRAAEDDLEREFAKLMTESLDARGSGMAKAGEGGRKPMDIVMPPRRGVARVPDLETSSEVGVGGLGNGGAVPFTMLARRGKARVVSLPADSRLVVSQQEEREKERAEQQAIKNLVIRYEDNYVEEDQSPSHLHPIRYSTGMVAGQKGGLRSGSMFRMGPQRPNASSGK
ncbi:mRNA decay protein [Savitreella phatthalungensis]